MPVKVGTGGRSVALVLTDRTTVAEAGLAAQYSKLNTPFDEIRGHRLLARGLRRAGRRRCGPAFDEEAEAAQIIH